MNIYRKSKKKSIKKSIEKKNSEEKEKQKMETRNEKKKENKCGLVDKDYFLKKYNIENKYNKEDFIIIDVLGDGNCGFRAISLQLYGTEEE